MPYIPGGPPCKSSMKFVGPPEFIYPRRWLGSLRAQTGAPIGAPEFARVTGRLSAHFVRLCYYAENSSSGGSRPGALMQWRCYFSGFNIRRISYFFLRVFNFSGTTYNSWCSCFSHGTIFHKNILSVINGSRESVLFFFAFPEKYNIHSRCLLHRG